HGYTRDHVLSLRVVLDTADVIEAARHARRLAASQPSNTLEELVFTVVSLLEQNAEAIGSCQPRTRFNRCGYLLHDVLTADSLDLARLLVGSEGTLGLFTEATLATIPLPEDRSLVLLGFNSLETAIRAVQIALPTGPAACDLVDRRLLSLAREHDAELAAF